MKYFKFKELSDVIGTIIIVLCIYNIKLILVVPILIIFVY